MTIAGVYLEPSLDLSEYSALLHSLDQALQSAPPGPVLVLGDFNARLGDLVGDHDSGPRCAATLAFAADTGLTLLNQRLRRNPDRWTWRDGRDHRSIVDLALCAGFPCASLRVAPPPTPVFHQMLVVTVAVHEAEIARDPDRWSWARRAFTVKPIAEQCHLFLEPVLHALADLWQCIGEQLDAQLLEGDQTPAAIDEEAQAIMDDAYELMSSTLRDALSGVACWSPTQTRRPFNPQPHVDWASMEDAGNSFLLSKVKSMLAAHRDRQILEQDPEAVPSPSAFADFYRDLFSADGAHLEEPFSGPKASRRGRRGRGCGFPAL